jgi:PDZ domain-containing protein
MESHEDRPRGEGIGFLAGLRRTTMSRAIVARAATMNSRVVISVSDTQGETVVGVNPSSLSLRRQAWGIPFMTLAFLIVVLVLGATVWPIQRFETAPGAADEVGDRLSVVGDDVTVYPPENGVRFVTALGSELTALQSFMGWIDPYVDVLTCEQRFGDCNPSANREIQLGAMATAKEIAAYVAASRLGLDATFSEGPAQVAGFDPELCDESSPARRACRVLEVGDVIESIDLGSGAVEIDVVSRISEVLADATPGDVATITVRSLAGEERTVEVELIASPSDATRTIVGFSARDTRTVDLPFEVDFDTDRIGGPSAGLSFTLALIDLLTPGELIPVAGVAVTGTIVEDGSVGAIGALVQKSIAVQRSGARYFLVPTAQGEQDIADAQAAVGDSVEIVPVATLDEALAALERLGGDPV